MARLDLGDALGDYNEPEPDPVDTGLDQAYAPHMLRSRYRTGPGPDGMGTFGRLKDLVAEPSFNTTPPPGLDVDDNGTAAPTILQNIQQALANLHIPDLPFYMWQPVSLSADHVVLDEANQLSETGKDEFE